jgi:hypothetical protein
MDQDENANNRSNVTVATAHISKVAIALGVVVKRQVQDALTQNRTDEEIELERRGRQSGRHNERWRATPSLFGANDGADAALKLGDALLLFSHQGAQLCQLPSEIIACMSIVLWINTQNGHSCCFRRSCHCCGWG